jgi:nucleoside-diphosphate-sugar epimerase
MSGGSSPEIDVRGKIVLLTRGNGFVGSRVAARLVALGCSVRATVRRAEAPDLQNDRIDEIEGDFVDARVTEPAARGAELVIHCAATAGPDLDPVRRVNAEGTRVVAEAALAAGARRYIQISTGSVYDRTGRDIVDESCPLKREGDPYGVTKAEADRIVLDAMSRGLGATILRPGAILGFHPTSTWAVRVPQQIRDGKVKLRIDGEDIIPYLHVENLVDAILLAIRSDAAAGRVYNVCDGQVTWRSYTDEVRSWFHAPPLEVLPADQVSPASYWKGHYESRKIRDELGYRPQRTYEEGMSDARNYWTHAHASSRTD